MKHKISFLIAFFMGLSCCSSIWAQVSVTDAVLVCRSRQCAEASQMMTREFLYNQLGSLLENNIGKSVLFCDADPNTHVCLNSSLNFDVLTGVTKGVVDIPSVTLLDAKACPDYSGYTFILDYKISVNEIYPECQAGLSKMAIVTTDDISIETPGFECRFTENGITALNASYEIDYIDFDYGILGATYTLAAGQVSKGGKTGYMLIRFKNISNDMNELRGGDCSECSEGASPLCQCEEKEPEVVVQEKVVKETVTEYEVAPIEVIIKTNAPIDGARTQDFRVNGVDVKNVPIVVDTAAPSIAPNVTEQKEIPYGHVEVMPHR